jgi:hypothetical protein
VIWWSRLWPASILVSGASLDALTIGHVDVPLRPWLAMWFLLVCPGMALVPLLQLSDRLVEVVLAVALSVALDTLVAGGFLYVGIWSPEASLVTLSGLSLGGVALQWVLRDAARRRHGGHHDRHDGGSN